MNEDEVPPGPWRWVPADVPEGEGGRGLLASDGTWVIGGGGGDGSETVHPAAEPLLSQAHLLRRLPNVLELWEDFRDAETPVTQADALLQFANAMTHLGWDYAGELDPWDEGSDEPPDGAP